MAESDEIKIDKVVAHEAAMQQGIQTYFSKLLEEGRKVAPAKKSTKSKGA